MNSFFFQKNISNSNFFFFSFLLQVSFDRTEIQTALDRSLQDLESERQARSLCIEYANEKNKVKFHTDVLTKFTSFLLLNQTVVVERS